MKPSRSQTGPSPVHPHERSRRKNGDSAGGEVLEMAHGGQGVLLGGVPAVNPGNVVVIGGGIVGTNAAKMACGLGAKVYILDMSLDRLRYLSDVMPANCFGLFSSPDTLRGLIRSADVVVGAVLIPGTKAPKLITREMLKTMKPGSVVVDVAIDQGGCSRPPKPRPTGIRFMWSTAFSITAWPICPGRCREHRPWP